MKMRIIVWSDVVAGMALVACLLALIVLAAVLA